MPPGKVSGDLPISVVVPEGKDGSPCLGYSVGSHWKPVVACLRGETWQRVKMPFRGNRELLQLGSVGGDLVALTIEGGSRHNNYRLFRQSADGWRSAPRLFAPSALARLGVEAPDTRSAELPTVGVTTTGIRSKRYSVELRNGNWRKLGAPVEGVGAGPAIGGPVIFPGRVLYPVNEANAEPWSFSIYMGRKGSAKARKVTRLSAGDGNAQGQLNVAGGNVWATWQEQHLRKDGRFRTAIYAARLDATGKVRRKVRLWRGVSIGPGSTQVLEFEGKIMALFLRGSTKGRGLEPVIRTIG